MTREATDETQGGDAAARFQFSAKDLKLDLAGTPEFVNSQIEFFRPALRRALGYADAPAPAAPSSHGGAAAASTGEGGSGAGRSALEEFLRRVRTRVGRGALQERILLFIYYLTDVKGRNEVGTE